MEEILQKKMKKRIIRKWRLNFMSILLLFVIIFVINSCANYQEQKKCIGSGGKWTSFDNSGADICGQQDSGIDVITQSCDCGPDKCWNRTSCIVDQERDFEYSLNSLILHFNGKSNGTIIAKNNLNKTKENPKGASNKFFRQYAKKDLQKMTKYYVGIIDNVDARFSEISDTADISLVYNQTLKNNEKNEALIRIKKDLENQWYTKSVFFNEEVHAI